MPSLKGSNSIEKFRKQFPDKEKPESDEPKMVLDISQIAVGQLGNLMSRYAAWREYSENLANIAVAEYLQEYEKYDFEYAKKYEVLPNDKATEKKMILTANEELHKRWEKVLEKQVYKDMLAKKVESLNNCIAVISREIARRGQSPPENR